MSKATQTSVDAGGLRYRSKASGSPFANNGAYSSQMSCFKCGKHRHRGMLKPFKMAGRTQFVCAPNCKELAAAEAAVAA